MYRKFETVEECDEFVGRTVLVEDVECRLIKIKLENNILWFTLEMDDGTFFSLTSSMAFKIVKVDGHTFGKKIE